LNERRLLKRVIMLRSISREQAKEEIMELLDKSDKLYYSDIAEALKLDLGQVVGIVEELEAEGKVGEAE
jgi:predicted ArsR family transcriptional regulator